MTRTISGIPGNISMIPSGTWPGSREMHEFCYYPAGLARGSMRMILLDFRKVWRLFQDSHEIFLWFEDYFKNPKQYFMVSKKRSRIPSGTGPGSREMHEFSYFPAGPGRDWMWIMPHDFRKLWILLQGFREIFHWFEDYFKNLEKYFIVSKKYFTDSVWHWARKPGNA